MTDRETLGVIDALHHFRYIIMGREIIVLTDHLPVKHIFDNPSYSPNRSRMFVTIQDFRPVIKHIKGKENILADALSRNYIQTVSSNEEESDSVMSTTLDIPLAGDRDTIIQAQDNDEVLAKVKHNLLHPDDKKQVKFDVTNLAVRNNILVRDVRSSRFTDSDTTQLVVPQSLVESALKLYHNNELSAHTGHVECTSL